MIRIVSGIYGLRDGHRTRPMSFRDGAFSADPDEERRLVAMGIAEYADGAAAEPPESGEQEAAERIDDMGINELRKLASTLGVSASGKRAELLERVRAAIDGEGFVEDEPEADEEPLFSEAMPS